MLKRKAEGDTVTLINYLAKALMAPGASAENSINAFPSDDCGVECCRNASSTSMLKVCVFFNRYLTDSYCSMLPDKRKRGCHRGSYIRVPDIDPCIEAILRSPVGQVHSMFRH